MLTLKNPFIDDEADLCDIPTEVDRESEKYLKQELKQEEFLDFDDISYSEHSGPVVCVQTGQLI
jgi:hypothetical protein